jgi:hypothetical protein
MHLIDLSPLEKNRLIKFLRSIKKRPPQKLDIIAQSIHNQVFSNRDCLACANCCKTTSPIFYNKDIERAAKALKIKAVTFQNQYLRTDEDGDWVLQSSPCPFLDENDNMCAIYEDRPLACRTYPHTDRKNFYQITELTARNLDICPAVVQIVTELENTLSK